MHQAKVLCANNANRSPIQSSFIFIARSICSGYAFVSGLFLKVLFIIKVLSVLYPLEKRRA